MREIRDLDLMEETVDRKRIVIASVVIPAVLILILVVAFMTIPALTMEPTMMGIIGGIALTMVLLVVHELIHGLFFRLLSPPGTPITFGFSNGMIFASAEGQVYPKMSYAVIVAAPFVLISLALIASSLVPGFRTAALLAFVLHTSGCAGDLYYLWVMATDPRITHAEDTSRGVTFYEQLSA